MPLLTGWSHCKTAANSSIEVPVLVVHFKGNYMKNLRSDSKSFSDNACPGAENAWLSATRPRRGLLLMAAACLFALGMTRAAYAESYTFSVNGSGITASGSFQASSTGPFGAYTISGIEGTFTDATNDFSGAITSLNSAPAPTTDSLDTYFSAPAFTMSNTNAPLFSYDNLFWPDGNSPAVCVDAPIFSGGDFDIYGLSFNIAGGYTVDLWSNGPNLGGYQLNDSFSGVPFTTPNMDGIADTVNVNVAPTPEPASLLLLGSALPGLAAVLKRRRKNFA